METDATLLVYKVLWVVSFPWCTTGPNIFGSYCILWHAKASTDYQQCWELLGPLHVTLSWICLLRFYRFVFRYSMFSLTTYVDCRSWLPQLMLHWFCFVRSNSEKTNKRKNKKRKLDDTEGKTVHSRQTNSGTELTQTGNEDVRKRTNKKKKKNWKVIKLFWWIILDEIVHELLKVIILIETPSWIVHTK